MYKMNSEKKKLWNEVLFWARRCSYKQADNHPEWHEKLRRAEEALEKYKQKN